MLSTRKPTIAGAAVLGVGLLLPCAVAVPLAHAQETGGTTLTINVVENTASGLSFSSFQTTLALNSSSLGGTPSYGSITFGITVTDTRAGNNAWTASVSSTDFTGPIGATPVSSSNLHYDAADWVTVQSGAESVTLSTPNNGTLGEPLTIVTATTNGPNSVRFVPDIYIPKSSFTTNGTFAATMTHSLV